VHEVLGVEANGAAERGLEPGLRGRRADREPEARGPERTEETLPHRVSLDDAHRAGEVVGQDRLRPVPVDRASESAGNELERVVPRDALEPALPLRADTPQRVEEPLRRVEGIEVVVDLAAERAA
jgi:hypothetical protein